MKIKRRTLELLRLWAIRLGSFTIVAALLYAYFFTSLFIITTYDIRGLDDETRNHAIAALVSESSNKTAWVLPHNRIFTYSSSAIITTVRQSAPDLSSIEIHPVGLHTVRIKVQLLKPLFALEANKAITEDGIVFETKKDIRAITLLTFGTSTTELVKVSGLPFTKMVLEDDMFLKHLSEFSSKISTVIFPVAKITVTEEGDVSLYDAEYLRKVMILKQADTEKVWSTLVSAIDTNPLKTKLEQEGDSLSYLDIRFGNKVFYKFARTVFQNSSSTDILGDDDRTTPLPTELR